MFTIENRPVGALIVCQIEAIVSGLNKCVLLGCDPLGHWIQADRTGFGPADGQKTGFESVRSSGESPVVYRDRQFHTAIIETKGPKSSNADSGPLYQRLSSVIEAEQMTEPAGHRLDQMPGW